MKICVVGAGIAGLCVAKVLHTFGHQMTVFEKQSEVGGVWSASRRYPALTTQNPRATYAFSDFPYPDDYPEWPSGEQVQRYLNAYAHHFGIAQTIQLRTEVISAKQQSGNWSVRVRHADGSEATDHFDWLVICNGVFSQPLIPDYPGKTEFAAAGGRLCHTSEFGNADDAVGMHVLVVGYGKSSCDVAQSVAARAASTTVVVRQLLWKVPKRFLGVLNYKYLLLTRLGEGLFEYVHLRGFERFLHGTGKPLRNAMLAMVQWVVTKQCRLEELELTPAQPFETIARSTIGLVSDGFFESVAARRISVATNTWITRLFVQDTGCYASLSDGRVLAADIVICGTGWHQTVPFLDAEVMHAITDAEGNFRLYRSLIPVNVPGLAFNGYNSSLFSQLNAEMGALWLADFLGGKMPLPSAAEQQQAITERLAWMTARTDGHHLKGTTVIPFSIHYVDELLSDLQLPPGRFIRLKQWLLPLDPGDFAFVARRLLARHQAGPHQHEKSVEAAR